MLQNLQIWTVHWITTYHFEVAGNNMTWLCWNSFIGSHAKHPNTCSQTQLSKKTKPAYLHMGPIWDINGCLMLVPLGPTTPINPSRQFTWSQHQAYGPICPICAQLFSLLMSDGAPPHGSVPSPNGHVKTFSSTPSLVSWGLKRAPRDDLS